MKVAFVGKGGSGKSSVSWLATKTLESMGHTVLAIDADHNMDLTSNLGLDPEKTPLMHKTDKEFMEKAGVKDGEYLISLLSKETSDLGVFHVFPHDAYTSSITTNISDTLSLINVGLGSPEVLFQTKCAHGLSGPLKYYLGLLNEKDSSVVIDSVAGTDMLNYGLYAGIDAVIGVAEPHRNSVKVVEQIGDICRKTNIPFYVVINKPSENLFYEELHATYGDRVLGEIPFDEHVTNYDFSKVSENTKARTKNMLEKMLTFTKRGNLATIKSFQEVKAVS